MNVSTIRINAELRDGIVANALAQRFAADRLQIAEQDEKVRKLTKERDQAREALYTYGAHLGGCAYWKRTPQQIDRIEWPKCDCGLDAALGEGNP